MIKIEWFDVTLCRFG